jgi:cytochrome c5
MQNKTPIRSFLLPGLLGVAAAAVLIVGCQTASVGPSAAAATQPAVAVAAAPVGKSGAQLWAETCNHCHNIRTPSSFNAAEWDVIVMHMRVRGDIPGDQARAIAEFLKAASH